MQTHKIMTALLAAVLVSTHCEAATMPFDLAKGAKRYAHQDRYAPPAAATPSGSIAVRITAPQAMGCVLTGKPGEVMTCGADPSLTDRSSLEARRKSMQDGRVGILYRDLADGLAERLQTRLGERFADVVVTVGPDGDGIPVDVDFELQMTNGYAPRMANVTLTAAAPDGALTVDAVGTDHFKAGNIGWFVPTAILLMPVGTLVSAPAFFAKSNRVQAATLYDAMDQAAIALATELSVVAAAP